MTRHGEGPVAAASARRATQTTRLARRVLFAALCALPSPYLRAQVTSTLPQSVTHSTGAVTGTVSMRAGSAAADRLRPLGNVWVSLASVSRASSDAAATTQARVVRPNDSGVFLLPDVAAGRYWLRARALGYRPDSALIEILSGEIARHDVALVAETSALQRVVVTGTMRPVTVAESPVKVEVVSTQFLARNVTNTVMEALKNVNGVQSQQDCGVCGTNNLRINGMDGPYTAVLIDGAPIMGSLASVYALNGIDPSLIEQIEIIKGPASTLYGTEAMGGVVNVITKDPRFAPRTTTQFFGTSHGEWNANASAAGSNGRAHVLVSGSLSHAGTFIDDNRDAFTDLPQYTRVALFGKLALGTPNDRSLHVAAKQYHETRFGGVENWTTNDRCGAERYGESIRTRRSELVGSYRLPTAARNLRVDFSATDHQQNSCYGVTSYVASQQIAFGQLVWTGTLGARHQTMAGFTARYQGYDDNTSVTARTDGTEARNAPERRFIPGVFAQDEVRLTDGLSLLGGVRADHHRAHGIITSPRVALKYELDAQQTIRLNTATGFRVVNLFSEDHAAISGLRRLVIRGPLQPERSLNASLNYNRRVGDPANPATFDIDLFATHFSNKIQPDYATDPTATIYENLDGYAISRGISAAIDRAFEHVPVTMNVGVTFADVYLVRAGVRRAQEFSPRVSSTFALSYTSARFGTIIDYTGRISGPMPLPVCVDAAGVTCAGIPLRSPWYSEQHLQLTRTVRSGFEITGAVKNLLNVVVPRPVFDARRPFDSDFQTNFVYGPMEGRRLQLGMRWVRPR